MDPCLIRTDSGIKRKKQAGIVRHTVLLAVMASASDGQFVRKVACRGSKSQDRPLHPERTGAFWKRQRKHAVDNGTGGAVRRSPCMQHDAIHKLLSSFPRVIADILLGYLDGNLVDRLDFRTLQLVSAERVTRARLDVGRASSSGTSSV